MNTAKQLGGAVGLAALVGIATAAGTEKLDFAVAFLASALLLVVAAVVAGLLPTQQDVANPQNSA